MAYSNLVPGVGIVQETDAKSNLLPGRGIIQETFVATPPASGGVYSLLQAGVNVA